LALTGPHNQSCTLGQKISPAMGIGSTLTFGCIRGGSFKLAHVGDGLHDSFIQYRRTFRVFDENGRLMLQALGGVPERLLKQADGSFAIRSEPASHLTFTVQHDRATHLTIDPSEFATPLAGDRIANGDPQSFHRAAAK